jgi:hypothetical protein
MTERQTGKMSGRNRGRQDSNRQTCGMKERQTGKTADRNTGRQDRNRLTSSMKERDRQSGRQTYR